MSIEVISGTCIVCQKKLLKSNGSHFIHGLPAHRKCMIEYTAWEVNHEMPGLSESEYRIEQQKRNLQHIIRRHEVRK